MIILNADQVAQVTVSEDKEHKLNPIALANGKEWVLPEKVCADPAHSKHHAFLATLPIRDVDKSEYPQVDVL